jgi:hypothetical protein
VAKELAALFKLNIAYLNAGKDITLLEIDIGRANEEIAELEEEIAAEEKTVTCPISGKVCPVLSK